MNPSRNLFLVGPTGAGKTTIGKKLATHYGLAFLDLDQHLERLCGMSCRDLFETEGETGFRRRESMLLAECSTHKDMLLATGAGAVLDWLNRSWLRERGYVVWLQATLEQQLARLHHDTRRPLLVGAHRHARLQTMAQVREPLYHALADLVIPALDEGVDSTTALCISRIDAAWQRSYAP